MNSTLKRMLLAIVAVAILAPFLVGCGRGSVAKVDGRRISRQEYHNRLERLRVPGPNNQPVEAGAMVLQQLIDEILILRLAENEDAKPTEEQVNERMKHVQNSPNFAAVFRASGLTTDQFKEMIRIQQAEFNLMTKGVKVTDEEVKEYYEANKDTQFTEPEMAEVAAIFTETRQDADKAMEMLKGKIAFGTVAQTLSIEPNSKRNDGRLPRPILRDDPRIPDAVKQTLFSTGAGKHTEPIVMDDGYVIFQMLNHRKKTTQQFKDVEFMIRQELMLQKGREKNDVAQKMDELRKKAEISVGIKRYERLLIPEAADEAQEGEAAQPNASGSED